jgi:hypothetical protein
MGAGKVTVHGLSDSYEKVKSIRKQEGRNNGLVISCFPAFLIVSVFVNLGDW